MTAMRLLARVLSAVVLGTTSLIGCSEGGASSAGPPAAPDPFAPVDELPERADLPDIFTSADGTRRVETPDDLRTWRRDELLRQFAHYVYGTAPDAGAAPTATTITRVDDALLDGNVAYEELAVTVATAPAPPLRVGIFLPKNVVRPPVFLALNKCGNQSLLADERIPTTTAFTSRDCPSGRGGQAPLWPVAAILAQGFGLVTFHESDAAPDSAERTTEGLRASLTAPGEPETRWGTIAAWSWALSRVVDFLQTRDDLDASRIAVMGHSRRGKAALWAAANDPRIALVVAHQSGTAGSALARSPVGESFKAINTLFPHWFNDIFPTFNDNELRLPIDQHQLLALVAPRPLLVVDGDDDTWADPPGSRAAVEAASPAWKLFGAPGLAEWTSRPGGHAVDASDWEIFTTFAARHLRR